MHWKMDLRKDSANGLETWSKRRVATQILQNLGCEVPCRHIPQMTYA